MYAPNTKSHWLDAQGALFYYLPLITPLCLRVDQFHIGEPIVQYATLPLSLHTPHKKSDSLPRVYAAKLPPVLIYISVPPSNLLSTLSLLSRHGRCKLIHSVEFCNCHQYASLQLCGCVQSGGAEGHWRKCIRCILGFRRCTYRTSRAGHCSIEHRPVGQEEIFEQLYAGQCGNSPRLVSIETEALPWPGLCMCIHIYQGSHDGSKEKGVHQRRSLPSLTSLQVGPELGTSCQDTIRRFCCHSRQSNIDRPWQWDVPHLAQVPHVGV